jgi:hypothetical protein
MGMVLSGLLGGYWGEYVGSSLNENGNPCDTYEHSNGTQVTYCDLQNQNPHFPR